MHNYNIKLKNEILKHLLNSIENNEPFSLIRFGDGGLKLIISYVFNNQKNLEIISKKEGIPIDGFKQIINLWSRYANQADYIDSPFVYEDNYYFWRRYKRNFEPINFKTSKLLNNWEIVYNNIKIETKNRNFCNPEFNWLCILNYSMNLFDILKNRKICFISIFDKIEVLKKYDIDFKQIKGHYQNQFKNSFKSTIEYIEGNIDKYDLWLNSSGELGRIYSGRIKELGGRVLDMGFVAQYWKNKKLPERFNKFLVADNKNPLCVKLTSLGENYRINI